MTSSRLTYDGIETWPGVGGAVPRGVGRRTVAAPALNRIAVCRVSHTEAVPFITWALCKMHYS